MVLSDRTGLEGLGVLHSSWFLISLHCRGGGLTGLLLPRTCYICKKVNTVRMMFMKQWALLHSHTSLVFFHTTTIPATINITSSIRITVVTAITTGIGTDILANTASLVVCVPADGSASVYK